MGYTSNDAGSSPTYYLLFLLFSFFSYLLLYVIRLLSFTRARVSLALLSLRKNGGLLVV